MTFSVFLVVLLSALLHASWNALGKSGKPSCAFYMIVGISNSILWSWTFLLVKIPYAELPWTVYAAYAGSMFSELLYAIGLVGAYRQMDISLGYPLIRSLPVLFVPVVMFLLPGHVLPGFLGACGIMLVIAGCMLVPVKDRKSFSWRNYTGPVMKYILLAAVGTTGYTVLDSYVLRSLKTIVPGNALALSLNYAFFVETGFGVALLIYMLIRREIWQEFRYILHNYPFRPVLSGIFSALAYALILYAMTRVSQLSFLQAFRQISLPFGVLFGILFFKEKVSVLRWLGVALIVSGLILIAYQ